MKNVVYLFVLLALLVPGRVALGAPDCGISCPPTETPIPATPWEPTPSDAPPEITPWPTPWPPVETVWRDTPTVTLGATPDPGPYPPPGTTITPDKDKPTRQAPNLVETLPVTGGGVSDGLLPIMGGILLGMFAFIIHVVRRQRDANP